MLQFLNNFWVILLSLFILYIIIYKIIYIDEPLNEIKYIEQFKNQKKIRKKINLNYIKKDLSTIASFYFGV